MKFAEEIFPLGTFVHSKTDGAYMNETLAKNLDMLAKKITHDMTFLGIISGHDMVGNGKSTLLTHVGCYLTWKINQLHNQNLTFTDKNMCLNSEELVETSFNLPPLSVIGLDEGDDLTTHGMKALAVRLKRYFRKCRQLNHILIIILPSFFELPKFYALSRSHFLIDVYFEKEFERGYFKFYGPQAKKWLYLKGKKEWDYSAHHSDFGGRFFSEYTFFPDLKGCVKRYKDKKFKDMLDDAEENQKIDVGVLTTKIRYDTSCKIYDYLKGKVTQGEIAEALGISLRHFNERYGEYKTEKERLDSLGIRTSGVSTGITIKEKKLIERRTDDDEGKIESKSE